MVERGVELVELGDVSTRCLLDLLDTTALSGDDLGERDDLYTRLSSP